jgi:hypothetical protein
MQYEDALREWGARKLEASYRVHKSETVSRPSVVVKFTFNKGYACCGGTDPDCYCSFAESPSAEVVAEGFTTTGKLVSATILDHWDFDFGKVLQELVEAGGGQVTT